MAAIKGRRQRTNVADTVFLGVRVSPVNALKVDEIAAARRISKAAVIDEVLAGLKVDASGRITGWVQAIPTDQEELPLKTA